MYINIYKFEFITDYVEVIGAKCSVGCVSFVKLQLENGSFHEDIGYYSAEESTKGLSIHNARIVYINSIDNTYNTIHYI